MLTLISVMPTVAYRLHDELNCSNCAMCNACPLLRGGIACKCIHFEGFRRHVAHPMLDLFVVRWRRLERLYASERSNPNWNSPQRIPNQITSSEESCTNIILQPGPIIGPDYKGARACKRLVSLYCTTARSFRKSFIIQSAKISRMHRAHLSSTEP